MVDLLLTILTTPGLLPVVDMLITIVITSLILLNVSTEKLLPQAVPYLEENLVLIVGLALLHWGIRVICAMWKLWLWSLARPVTPPREILGYRVNQL